MSIEEKLESLIKEWQGIEKDLLKVPNQKSAKYKKLSSRSKQLQKEMFALRAAQIKKGGF